MGGIVGRFMKSFGLTMAFAIMVSLLVSFTLTPMLSARWLKVDRSDEDEGALVEGLAGVPRRSTCVYTRMLEWSMAHRAHRRRRRGAGAAVERAAVHDRQQELPAATTTSRSSRSTCARRKARASRRPRSSPTASRTRSAQQLPEVDYTLVHDRRRPGADANLGNDLRAAEADRGAQARSVRGDGRRPQRDPAAARAPTCARRCSRSRPSAAAAARTPTSSSSINGPDLKQARDVSASSCVDARQDASRASSTSTRR